MSAAWVGLRRCPVDPSTGNMWLLVADVCVAATKW
jgi:hypothetical protein